MGCMNNQELSQTDWGGGVVEKVWGDRGGRGGREEGEEEEYLR